MGSLKPIGSEKLQGMDKIRRMIEISRYNEYLPNPINESESNEYSRTLADGNRYEIVKEKIGYIIKQQISEGVSEYIEPMKNRKYFSSYSQALRKLNLMAKELNVLHENTDEVSLFGEEKKYFLKKEKSQEIEEQTPPSPPAPPAPAPAPAPVPAEPMDTTGDVPAETEGELPPSDEEMPDEDMEGKEEEVTFKSIQKLTGKLAQKIRDFESKGMEDEEGMDGNDVKYVINSILSALDLSVLDEDDVDEILARFEGEEEGMPEEGEMETEEPEAPAPEEGEELPPPPAEGEVAEMQTLGDKLSEKIKGAYTKTMSDKVFGEMYDEDEDEFKMDMNFEDDEEEDEDDYTMRGARKHRRMYGDDNHFSHGTFGESKIDKILEKYFEIEDKERQLNEEKMKKMISENKSEIKRLSTTIPQERVAIKFLMENKNAELIGLSNKRNLIFRLNEDEFKISPKGTIL